MEAQTQEVKTKTVDEIGEGIAAQYPGDIGLEQHESVIFKEDFEAASIADVVKNWSWSRGDKDYRLSHDNLPRPEGSSGNKRLNLTILGVIGENHAGIELLT